MRLLAPRQRNFPGYSVVASATRCNGYCRNIPNQEWTPTKNGLATACQCALRFAGVALMPGLTKTCLSTPRLTVWRLPEVSPPRRLSSPED